MLKEIEKTASKLTSDADKLTKNSEKYLTKAYSNTEKMTDNRKIKIGTRSIIIGTIIGLATTGLSVITGSNPSIATATGVSVGLMAGSANAVVQANNHGTIQQTKDKISSTIDKLK